MPRYGGVRELVNIVKVTVKATLLNLTVIPISVVTGKTNVNSPVAIQLTVKILVVNVVKGDNRLRGEQACSPLFLPKRAEKNSDFYFLIQF